MLLPFGRFFDARLGSVLTNVILTDGRLLDAFGMVNERRKIVQKVKAPSVPVGLREHSPSALSVDAVSTLSLKLGPFFRPFQAFGLATLSPQRSVMDSALNSTRNSRQKHVQNRKT